MPVLDIAPLAPADRRGWEALARGYKHFYGAATTDAEYDRAWQRLLDQDGVFGLGARVDGQLVGIAHYLFHTGVWTPSICYLQDLFTLPTARGKGVARALIDAVAQAAEQQGASRFYWLTQEQNTGARILYDKIASNRGFVRYDYPLTSV
ncbi:MAG: GNAT family N-acetyltransferase [Pseudomonadota bacterium]